ncbi:hypothetical protein C2845_PM15G06030 [Panicum miliaceum]|uniref:Flavodoxin-like domain-containing protein n=1 Tax=Panicum miliaceum TaxID=4540 RepID=A0A3L6Q5U1_PANMI|nr:hypothetical protein C2845_PM15G06030 [Panicum miliaceum]
MAPSVAEADLAASSSGCLLVLYASQTGNAMDAAERVGREAERGACPAVDVHYMDGFDPVCSNLKSPQPERFVVFVVSTTGQGDPPDSMKGLWRYLLQKGFGRAMARGGPSCSVWSWGFRLPEVQLAMACHALTLHFLLLLDQLHHLLATVSYSMVESPLGRAIYDGCRPDLQCCSGGKGTQGTTTR